jgi:hypothetical protein
VLTDVDVGRRSAGQRRRGASRKFQTANPPCLKDLKDFSI